jgi:hypothetical protein
MDHHTVSLFTRCAKNQISMDLTLASLAKNQIRTLAALRFGGTLARSALMGRRVSALAVA